MSTFCSPAVTPELADKIAHTLRFLAIDGVNAANSGHPGMPMGCADIATVLLTRFLRIDPNDPNWCNRDRFALSAGHGSMLLYSMLHFLGFIEVEELKRFRQIDSLTPGHPEVGHVPGVDATTGPLGAGFATATGFALSERMYASRYNTPEQEVVDHYTYVLMGDGCNMEGVTNEAASLAGHLKLGKLIVLYDDNEISIEGDTDLAFTENVNKRYEAMGWHVQDIDGHDQNAIAEAISAAQADDRPSLVVCHTVIGKGSPNMVGSHEVHGAPLGAEEALETKKACSWVLEDFHIPQEVEQYFVQRREQLSTLRQEWDSRMQALTDSQPEKASELTRLIDRRLPEGWESSMPVFEADPKGMATRASSGKVLNAFAGAIDELVGGSADLAPSNKSEMTNGKWNSFIDAGDYSGRNIHFGVREHAMGNIINGLALDGFVPLGATFMVFHDYMRPTLRLAAMQKCGSIFVYTHDSFYVGEDGPTHQPVEHLAAIRSIPNVHLMRPCDANETAEAWRYAISRRNGPTALALTRQNLPTLDRSGMGPAGGTLLGGYILTCDENPEILLIASGSEVHLALGAAKSLREEGRRVRVVSMPCLDLFLTQPEEYQHNIIPPSVSKRVVLEAGIEQGWGRILGQNGLFIGMDDFGASGPCKELEEKFGFTLPSVIKAITDSGF